VDLFVANGHVYPFVDKSDWGTTFAQRPLLFRNIGGKKFDLIPAVKGTALAETFTGRGAVYGDLFNRGKLDIVISQIDGPPALLRNISSDRNHWVGLKLIGGRNSPRDAVGATAYLSAGGVRRRMDVISGGSYASTHDQRLHFGLGQETGVEKLEIDWPDGVVETFKIPGVDRYFTVEEGKGVR
jgi:hypothetical protein